MRTKIREKKKQILRRGGSRHMLNNRNIRKCEKSTRLPERAKMPMGVALTENLLSTKNPKTPSSRTDTSKNRTRIHAKEQGTVRKRAK